MFVGVFIRKNSEVYSTLSKIFLQSKFFKNKNVFIDVKLQSEHSDSPVCLVIEINMLQ